MTRSGLARTEGQSGSSLCPEGYFSDEVIFVDTHAHATGGERSVILSKGSESVRAGEGGQSTLWFPL